MTTTEIPGPKNPPLIIFQRMTNPLKFLEKCAEKYGDTFQIKFGLPYVFFTHPQAIEEVFKVNPKLYSSYNSSWQPLLGDYSLLLLDGDSHKRQRQLLMPPFHGARMQAYGELICNISEQIASKWVVGEPFSMIESAQKISLKVILQAVFGLYEGNRYNQIEQLLLKIAELFSSPWQSSILFLKFLQRDFGVWSPWGRFLRLRQAIDDLLYAEISERRQKLDSERTDILTMLLLARDENGEGMSDQELRDELMTLLIGGNESTAAAISWAFYWIHNQPEIYQKLLAELETLGDKPDRQEIMKLPYLNAVCSETLRIYPPAVFAAPRKLKSPVTIMGTECPEGAIFNINTYLTHHREDLYPEPKKFKPERFLERQYSAYEFLPFGGGHRRCIGAALAMFEMKLVLATILKRYSFSLLDQKPVKPVRRGIFFAPAGGIKMAMISNPVKQL